MELIAYGTRLILNGYTINKAQMDKTHLNDFLETCSALLEPITKNRPVVIETADPQGGSLAMLMPESYVMLHAFPDLGVVSSRIFSHRHLLVSRLSSLFTEHFVVGRHESHLSNFSSSLSKNESDVKRLLRGDRVYTMLQVSENLVF